MEITRAALGFVAAACLTAGAGSAWLLTRGDQATGVGAAGMTVSPDPGVSAPGAVEQSEAIVSEPPRVVEEPAPVKAERPAPRREARPASRPARQTAPPARSEPRPVEAAPVLERAEAAPIFEYEPAPIAPAPVFEELIVSANSVVGLQVESSLTSEHARVEDEVVARVTRDVKVGDRVAIPAGAQAFGEVTLVERGGKMRDKARLGVRFTSIVLADGTRVPVETDTIIREGSSPGNESAAKIGGGAIGGAIIGGILGGARGAIIGGSAGAGAGTAAVMAGGRNAATLNAGTPITVRLLKPAVVTVEK